MLAGRMMDFPLTLTHFLERARHLRRSAGPERRNIFTAAAGFLVLGIAPFRCGKLLQPTFERRGVIKLHRNRADLER